MRGRNQVEQASGTMPILPKTKPIRAFVGGEPDVHRQRHRRADADRRAVDRGDDRLGARVDREADPAAGVADARDDRGVVEPVVQVGHRRLRASRRDRTRCRPTDRSMPAQNARPRPVTTTAATSSSALARVEGVDQLLGHRHRERVELVGTVEREREDAVLDRPVEGVVVRHLTGRAGRTAPHSDLADRPRCGPHGSARTSARPARGPSAPRGRRSARRRSGRSRRRRASSPRRSASSAIIDGVLADPQRVGRRRSRAGSSGTG